MNAAAICALAVALPMPVTAMPATVWSTTYEPQIATQGGRIESCGFLVEALARDATNSSYYYYFSATIALSFYKGKEPTPIAKLGLGVLRNNTPSYPPVKFAYVRTAKQSTIKWLEVSAESTSARLLIGPGISADDSAYLLPMEFLTTGGTMGASTDLASTDVSVSIAAADKNTVAQVNGCMQQALDDFGSDP